MPIAIGHLTDSDDLKMWTVHRQQTKCNQKNSRAFSSGELKINKQGISLTAGLYSVYKFDSLFCCLKGTPCSKNWKKIVSKTDISTSMQYGITLKCKHASMQGSYNWVSSMITVL